MNKRRRGARNSRQNEGEAKEGEETKRAQDRSMSGDGQVARDGEIRSEYYSVPHQCRNQTAPDLHQGGANESILASRRCVDGENAAFLPEGRV